MKLEIDQSGKIEQTEKNTVLAYTNGSSYTVLIPAKIKRQIQERFRACGYTKVFIYYLFSVGIYYLLSSLKQKSQILIDVEYPGKNRLIKQLVQNLLRVNAKPVHELEFVRIGNHPKVHYAAKNVFDKKVPPNKSLTLHEIIFAIKKTDGRLRECLSTLVDAQPRSMSRRYHNRNDKSSSKNRLKKRKSTTR